MSACQSHQAFFWVPLVTWDGTLGGSRAPPSSCRHLGFLTLPFRPDSAQAFERTICFPTNLKAASSGPALWMLRNSRPLALSVPGDWLGTSWGQPEPELTRLNCGQLPVASQHPCLHQFICLESIAEPQRMGCSPHMDPACETLGTEAWGLLLDTVVSDCWWLARALCRGCWGCSVTEIWPYQNQVSFWTTMNDRPPEAAG